MKHLLTIQEITHWSRDKKILWHDTNLPNTFHGDGEEFILKALFVGDGIPENYYFGVDNRSSIDVDDTLLSLVDEPSAGTHGYARQIITSEGQFVMGVSAQGNHMVNSPIVYFSAIGGSWGPVKNLFLTNTSQDDYDGYLIASVPLTHTVTVLDGESISMRMGLTLRDAPIT